MTRPRIARAGSRLAVLAGAAALAGVWLIPAVGVDENRQLRQFPDLSRAGLASADDFRAIDGGLVDHLGAKSAVVDAVSRAVTAAGASPSAAVVRGDGGRPYLSNDFTMPCDAETDAAVVAAQLREARERVAGRGATLLWAIAPDKSSAERESVGPFADALFRCADERRAALETVAADDRGLLVAWDETEAAIGTGDDLYLAGDSHWNPRGATRFAELLLDRLAATGVAPKGIFDERAVAESEPVAHHGDLFLLMGAEQVETYRPRTTTRTGVETEVRQERVDGKPVKRWISTSAPGGPPLVEGRVLLLHDSYLNYNEAVLAPYFADLTVVPTSHVRSPGELAQEGGFDHVVVQQVQRSALQHLTAVRDAEWISAR